MIPVEGVLFTGPIGLDTTGETTGWSFTGDAAIEEVADPHGDDAAAFVVRGDGSIANPGLKSVRYPVQEDDLIEFSGWIHRASGTAGIAELRLYSYTADGTETLQLTLTASPAVGAWSEAVKKYWRVSSGVVAVAFMFVLTGTPAITEEHWADDVVLAARRTGNLRVLSTGTITIPGGHLPGQLRSQTTVVNLPGLTSAPTVLGVFQLDPDGTGGMATPFTQWMENTRTASADTTTDDFAHSVAHGLFTGDRIRFVDGGTTNVDPTLTYYVRHVSTTVIKIATSLANAQAGTTVDITGTNDSLDYVRVNHADTIRPYLSAWLESAYDAPSGELTITAYFVTVDELSDAAGFRYYVLGEQGL
jgi:hypothetical protein